ncbi:MAG: nucleotide sugar dehydrogenase [Candidatus Aenigmatarchaeota archaeon]|nr:MAG: nucleotide sugar dehydrogenase [Candidatus Aenigmarchaeota archaeon]
MIVYGKGRKEIREAFRKHNLKVSVYGLGKMGLPLAAVYAEKGALVTGVDIDKQVIENINKGINHVNEPELDELVKKNVNEGRLSATDDPVLASKETDVKIIIIPTLLDGEKKPDLKDVIAVSEKIAKGMKKGDFIIVETTMPIGATNKKIRPALETTGLKAGIDFGLAYCPERTSSGRAIRDILGAHIKVVGGFDKKSTKTAEAIYTVINSRGVIKTDSRVAEAVKVFEGIYRDVNIALSNQLALVSSELGFDAVEAFKIANTQVYSNLHMPGTGVGGHCIPVYSYFVTNGGITSDTSLLKLARKVNDSMAKHTVDLTVDVLNGNGRKMKDSNVLVLGLAFRGGVKEVRNSPSFPIINMLQELGANTFVYDPLFDKDETKAFGFRYKKDFRDIDCIVVATDHNEFKNYDWKKIKDTMRGIALVDGKQLLNPAKARSMGFDYRGIGYV